MSSSKQTHESNNKCTTTLVQATESSNYTHWLTGTDIGDVMQVYCPLDKAGWRDGAVDIIMCTEQLQKSLSSLVVTDHPYVFFLNIRNNHWVTLLVPATKKAYLFDSLGPSSLEASEYISTVESCGYKYNNASIIQQHDGYNCGVWCLLNLQAIQKWWLNHASRSCIDVLKTSLNKCATIQEEEEFLRKKRQEFYRQLGGTRSLLATSRSIPASALSESLGIRTESLTYSAAQVATDDDRSYSEQEIAAMLSLNNSRLSNKPATVHHPNESASTRNAPPSHHTLSDEADWKKEFDDIVSIYVQAAAETKNRKRVQDEKIAADRAAEATVSPKKPRSIWSKNK